MDNVILNNVPTSAPGPMRSERHSPAGLPRWMRDQCLRTHSDVDLALRLCCSIHNSYNEADPSQVSRAQAVAMREALGYLHLVLRDLCDRLLREDTSALTEAPAALKKADGFRLLFKL